MAQDAMNYSSSDIRALVRDDMVHRDVYEDPDIFDLEMERIFERSWVYVGHESQVPDAGDFFCTRIGRQPVVMARHKDGKVYVLIWARLDPRRFVRIHHDDLCALPDHPTAVGGRSPTALLIAKATPDATYAMRSLGV